MKNRKRHWPRIGLALLAAGAVLLGAGLALGGFSQLKRESAADVRTATYDAGVVTALRIEGIAADVRVEKADGDAVEVTYFEGAREGVEVKLENGILTLKEYWGHSWRDYIRFMWRDARKIVVRVPGELGGAAIFSTSGDVALADVPVANDLTMGTTSGDVEACGRAGSLKMTSTSGALAAREMEIADGLTAGTTSGDIVLAGLSVGADLKATSTSGGISVSETDAQSFTLGSVSGDIRLSGARAAKGEGNLSATTTSGGITLTDVSAAAYSFGTVSGDLTGVLPGSVRDYTITTGTVSGDNALPAESYGGRRTIKATTTSGDIKLLFEE